MKAMRNLLLAGMILLFCRSMGQAQLVYSNAFIGGAVNINQTAPTMANDFAGGISSALWNSVNNSATSYLYKDGSIGATANSVLLPFAPEAGYVYTLTVSVTFTSDPGNWLALGFASYNPASNTAPDPRFNISYVNGNPWSLFRPGAGNGGVQLYYSRSGLVGSRALIPATFPNTNTISIVLDTTGSNWIASEFVNGTQVGTNYVYATIPSIGSVGIGQTTLNSSTGIKWNYLTLEAAGTGPTVNTVNAAVNFSPANTGLPLNPSFCGLGYEKKSLTGSFFTSNNVPLVKLFSIISSPAVLRIGGGTVDTTGWGGISNTIPITASEVDAFAGFIKTLPTNWSVIYGINLESNTPVNAVAEATYAAKALGPRLLGFEIGNEPEYGFSTYGAFLARWRPLAAAMTNAVPGWAVTNGGNGWILDGADAGQGQLSAYTDPFARDESGVVSLLTQHYYRAGPSINDTMQLLLQPDPFLVTLVNNIVGAAAGHCSLGARITECASYSAGGVQGVSDVYGAALWSLDYMFTVALNGGQGINFHGGGQSPYSPIVDNGTAVQRVGPELYGLKMVSLLPHGNVVPATVTPASNINFTAYGVRRTDGTISALLNNKETSNTVAVSVNLGPDVTGARLIELTGLSLYSTSGCTLGGATINPDGTWNGGGQEVLSATNGQLTVYVPPISAVLLNPVLAPTEIAFNVNGHQLTLSWPTNYVSWLLESNSTGLASTNWFPVSGSGNTNRAQITIQPGQSNVFYRLSRP